jgi:chaperone modulatory protein CbpM
MAKFTVTTATAVTTAEPLALGELAHACGADTAWVVQLVEVGILRTTTDEPEPERWHFSSSDLQDALEARRLERDFGVDLEAAALVLDLRHEVRRLKALLRAHGLEPSRE